MRQFCFLRIMKKNHWKGAVHEYEHTDNVK